MCSAKPPYTRVHIKCALAASAHGRLCFVGEVMQRVRALFACALSRSRGLPQQMAGPPEDAAREQIANLRKLDAPENRLYQDNAPYSLRMRRGELL
jgi:hypothetical protein